jgi:hypothetical protein
MGRDDEAPSLPILAQGLGNAEYPASYPRALRVAVAAADHLAHPGETVR